RAWKRGACRHRPDRRGRMRLLQPTGLSRRSEIVLFATALCFSLVLIGGPLASGDPEEQVFAVALTLDSVLLIAFLTRRLAFAFAVPAIVFGGLLIAGTLKFHYLTTPLLAPDLVYFLNRDLLDVATRYPSVMIALVAGGILIPGLL